MLGFVGGADFWCVVVTSIEDLGSHWNSEGNGETCGGMLDMALSLNFK